MTDKQDSSAPNSPGLTGLSGEQAEERAAREGRERIGEAKQWLFDEKYHDDAANELAPDFAKYAAFYAESECSRLASRVEELEGGSGYLLPQAVAMQLLDMLQPLDVNGEPNTLLALTKKAMRLISELDKALKIASCQLAQGSNMDFSDANIERWQEDARRIEQELLTEAKKALVGAHAEEKE